MLETLPPELKGLSGEIVDIDSHEMMPAQMWVREMGPSVSMLADHWLHNSGADHVNHPNKPGYVSDDAPITSTSVWLHKGSTAPGATDITRRPEIMDVMGVKKQIMFPTGVGMFGMLLANTSGGYGYADTLADRKGYGRDLTKTYNEWAIKVTTDRVVATGILFEDTMEKFHAEATYLVESGIRAVWLPAGMLPGGKSPAHTLLDPTWKLFADNDVAVCVHTGVEDDVYHSREWGNAPAFEGFRLFEEFKLDPWSRCNNYILAQNYLSTMVLGGVFERHPTLRFGVIELGAFWIGPLCDTMDLWYAQDPGGTRFSDGTTQFLPHPPSFYVKRNVRVSAFDFEPVDKYIRQYDLEDVLCFASDYPHVEGGKNPMGAWYEMLKPLGADIVRKFFVENGKWLLP